MSTPTTDTTARRSSPSGDQFSPTELEQFENQGYVIVRGLGPQVIWETMLQVTREQLAGPIGPVEYEADVHYPGSPLSRTATGGDTVRRLLWAHARHPVFTQWICFPGVVHRLQQLLGTPVVMPQAHHNCIMTKQPHFSSQTLWHQDSRFWSFEQPELVSVWLALGDETADNGCLSVIPGTHRMNFAPDRFDEGTFLDPTQPRNRELIDGSVTAELQAGDVLFFHSRTFHAAGDNRTEQPKHSAVFTFHSSENHPLPGSRSASMPEMILPVL